MRGSHSDMVAKVKTEKEENNKATKECHHTGNQRHSAGHRGEWGERAAG